MRALETQLSGPILIEPLAHGDERGFCVLSEYADVIYGCTAYHDAETEGAFRYDDPEVGISWPHDLALTPSPRDRSAPALKEIAATLPFAYA